MFAMMVAGRVASTEQNRWEWVKGTEKPQLEELLPSEQAWPQVGHPFLFILFFNFTILYWFYHISHESATGIHGFPILNPPPSPYHPSGSSQCTSPKHPVSCIEPGLATHFIYDIIHVSMPFSQIIPPSPSPTESKRLFYTSVSLLLSRI